MVPGRAACFLALCVCFIVSFEIVRVFVREFCAQPAVIRFANSRDQFQNFLTHYGLNRSLEENIKPPLQPISTEMFHHKLWVHAWLLLPGRLWFLHLWFLPKRSNWKKLEPEPELKPHKTSSISSVIIQLLQMFNWCSCEPGSSLY